VLDLDHYLDELAYQGRRLRDSARQSTLLTSVESCPGWTVERLLAHTTKVHHWVLAVLRGADPNGFEFSPPDQAELFEVYDAGLAALLDQLRRSPAHLQVWTMVPAESARLYWARRQAHETAIHRVDAELAAGYGVQDFEPDFAADGIDELLTGLAAVKFSSAEFSAGLSEPRRISLIPMDSNSSWTLTVSSQGLACLPAAVDDADLSVFATVSDLYRWAWNRAGEQDVTLRGDLTLADRWRQNFRVGASRN
jgi:uncharacterized protein (TIGR03083 family)